jgi:hypothetical protein
MVSCGCITDTLVAILIIPFFAIFNLTVGFYDLCRSLCFCTAKSANLPQKFQEAIELSNNGKSGKALGSVQMLRFRYDEKLNWTHLNALIQNNIPFVLTNVPLEELKERAPLETKLNDDVEELKTSTLLISQKPCVSMCESLAEIDSVSRSLFGCCNFKLHFPLWFSGGYSSGLAHVDATHASCNLYTLFQGSKLVTIIPIGFLTSEERKNLHFGTYSLYFPNTSGKDTTESIDLSQSQYVTRLEAGDLLIFRNTASVHQFQNSLSRRKTPIAMSARYRYCASHEDRYSIFAIMFNPWNWWQNSTVLARQIWTTCLCQGSNQLERTEKTF